MEASALTLTSSSSSKSSKSLYLMRPPFVGFRAWTSSKQLQQKPVPTGPTFLGTGRRPSNPGILRKTLECLPNMDPRISRKQTLSRRCLMGTYPLDQTAVQDGGKGATTRRHRRSCQSKTTSNSNSSTSSALAHSRTARTMIQAPPKPKGQYVPSLSRSLGESPVPVIQYPLPSSKGSSPCPQRLLLIKWWRKPE